MGRGRCRAEGRIFEYRKVGRKHSVNGEGEITEVRGDN